MISNKREHHQKVLKVKFIEVCQLYLLIFKSQRFENNSVLIGADGEFGGDSARLQEKLDEGERNKPLLCTK